MPQGQAKSPPRGPAALRAPPTGPSANRTLPPTVSTPVPQRYSSSTPTATPHGPEVSPTNPPQGPRGYVPPARTTFPPSRGGRGGASAGASASSGGGSGGSGAGAGAGSSSSSSSASWNPSRPPGHSSGPPQAASAPSGPPAIPTGPRVTPSSTPATPSGPPSLSRPFNPPTGPSAQHAGGPRQTLAQNLLSTMPHIVPGGKLDPAMTPLLLGVTKDIEPHYKKLKDEEEKIREELRVKQERLRKSLYTWNRLERDASAWEVRSDLSEKSMKNLAGEGIGGAAF
ncbi:hypothetical protein ESCO_001048 [Escovopsis weberi]|uniref:Uncharacterized protein n=1 Tax=Escovopsis weberi TaxID=150374 RepID=A0A0M8N285_ESCWE|nr:hypothetical protein ESCO_001048 [Escovopsis weberi]